MKNIYKVLISVILSLFIGGCSNDDILNTTYSFFGTVIDEQTRTPLTNIPVVVTNGVDIHTSVKTDSEGVFRLSININEIDGSYYILVGDETCVKKQVDIHGFTANETNLGTIIVIGPTEPVVNLSGHEIDNGVITCQALIMANGRLEIEKKGFCLGKSAAPTIEDETVVCGSGDGSFKAEILITDLDVSSTYYIRPFATNAKGTGYGNEFSVTTENGLPTVRTGGSYADYYSLTATSVTLRGNIIDNGGFDISERGFCWDTTGDPNINSDSKYIGGNQIGDYTIDISDLQPNTQYYFRAYAKNKNGISYGQISYFTTKNGNPTVTTTNVKYGTTVLECYGNVTKDGGFPIIRRGFCYSIHESPTLMDDFVTDSSKDIGEYIITVDGLEEGTTYYVKAFAENQQGLSYGEEIERTTMVVAEFSVVDTNDNYIPNAELHLEYEKYICDNQGKKSLRAAIGTYRFWVKADGYETSKHEDILINKYNKSFKTVLSKVD